MSSIEKKIVLLNFIKDRKEILFGSLSPELSADDKKVAWMSVLEKGQSIEIISVDRDWTYARDVTWGNWKKRSMAKRDNSRKTGAAGGAKCKLTAFDNLIFDIIGRDSPVLDGLPVPESGRPLPSPEIMSESEAPNNPEPNATEETLPTNTSSIRRMGRVVKRTVCDDGEREAKKRKTELQIKLMEMDERRKALEILKLERELNLPSSKFTRKLLDYSEVVFEAEYENGN